MVWLYDVGGGIMVAIYSCMWWVYGGYDCYLGWVYGECLGWIYSGYLGWVYSGYMGLCGYLGNYIGCIYSDFWFMEVVWGWFMAVVWVAIWGDLWWLFGVGLWWLYGVIYDGYLE